jgi:ATP-dependent DNA helicase RecG
LAYFKKSELLNANRKFTILLSESNNHVDAIVHLKKSGLIFEHPVSTEENPVYILDREIMKDNFANELIKLYGEQYLTWSGTLKEIMNIVFRYTIYNETPIRPVEITPEIYLKESGKFIDPKKYESLGRKVRKIISDLQSKGFIINKDKGFVLNLAYKPDNTLF